MPDGRLVIFDFGLATLWARDALDTDGDAPRNLTGETGSLRYMAPEVASSQPYNHKAEVFSFATVLWEMASHRKPFDQYTAETFVAALNNNIRPVGAAHVNHMIDRAHTHICATHEPVARTMATSHSCAC